MVGIGKLGRLFFNDDIQLIHLVDCLAFDDANGRQVKENQDLLA